ncbi:MAG: YigZ family protein [FCB group bacterium]|nr:YigZ family protein [FCB group bacterium]
MVTPATKNQVSYKEKRSEFIGILYPIGEPGDVAGQLRALRKEYHKATHICWAYRAYDSTEIIENHSDAGEPSGTAGKPILNVLRRYQLVNGVLYVIRYFGGIKLGKKGLAGAYEACADLAAASAALVEFIPRRSISVECPYEYYGEIPRLVSREKGRVLAVESAELLRWKIELPRANIESFRCNLENVTAGQGRVL